MNIRIYSACKKSTNIKTNEYIRPNIFEYSNISPTLSGHFATVQGKYTCFYNILQSSTVQSTLARSGQDDRKIRLLTHPVSALNGLNTVLEYRELHFGCQESQELSALSLHKNAMHCNLMCMHVVQQSDVHNYTDYCIFMELIQLHRM